MRYLEILYVTDPIPAFTGKLSRPFKKWRARRTAVLRPAGVMTHKTEHSHIRLVCLPVREHARARAFLNHRPGDRNETDGFAMCNALQLGRYCDGKERRSPGSRHAQVISSTDRVAGAPNAVCGVATSVGRARFVRAGDGAAKTALAGTVLAATRTPFLRVPLVGN